MREAPPTSIRERYHETLGRIAAACARSGRSTEDVTLVAVSKTFSVEHIRALYDAGHRDFGENKVQELLKKYDSFRAEESCPEINWHFVGHLQRNKVKNILGRVHLFHGLDSIRLAEEVNRRAGATGQIFQCLIQINISEEQTKFGVSTKQAIPFAKSIEHCRNIRIAGLMGMAQRSSDSDRLRSDYARMRHLKDEIAALKGAFSGCRHLSMGMSHDFEIAIDEGATHVRIGTAIFGLREG